MENRNIAIDIAKGIGIILVVWGHVIQVSAGEGNFDYWGNSIFEIIYSFHMPLFIFLSGFTASYSLNKRSHTITIKNRFTTLMIPFLSWGFIMYFIKFIGNVILNERLDSTLLEFMIATMLNPGLGLWFFWVLFFLYLIIILAKKLENKIGIVSYILIYILLLTIPINDVFYIFMIKWLYPFFIIGYLINSRVIKIPTKKHSLNLIILIVFSIFIQNFGYYDYIYNSKMSLTSASMLGNILDYSYRYIIAFLGIFLVIASVDYIKNRKIINFLMGIGKYSFDIYSLQPTLNILLGFVPFILTNSVLFNAGYAPGLTLVIIMLSILVSKLISCIPETPNYDLTKTS